MSGSLDRFLVDPRLVQPGARPPVDLAELQQEISAWPDAQLRSRQADLADYQRRRFWATAQDSDEQMEADLIRAELRARAGRLS